MSIVRSQLFTVSVKASGVGSSVARAFASVPSAGSLLVACMSNGDDDGFVTTVSITDDIGDGVAWTASALNPKGLGLGSATEYRIFYKVVGTPVGGGLTVSCGIGAKTSATQLFVANYGSDSGAVNWAITGIPVFANGTVLEFPADAGDITTTVADAVLIGFSGSTGDTWNQGTGFTRQAVSTNWANDAVQDRIVTSAATYPLEWGTTGGNDSWVALGIAFGATPVGGGGPTVSTVSSNSATEASAIVHTVTLSGATSGSTNFAATLVGVTATGGGTDFTSALGSATYSNGVTFSGGNMVVPTAVTSWTVSVPTATDALDEENETYTLTVGGVAGTGTITDDDALPSLSVADATQSGASVTFTVNMTPVSGRSVTVAFATANGSKTAGVDYTANSGTLTFAPGETSKTVVVAVL